MSPRGPGREGQRRGPGWTMQVWLVERKGQDDSRPRGESREEAEPGSVDSSFESRGPEEERRREAWRPGYDVRAWSSLVTGARARGEHAGWGRGPR